MGAVQLLEPGRDLPEVLREMESEVLPERENRNNGGRHRGHRERRGSRPTALGPPRLSALCSLRLRHNLLHELKHIAIAATPGGTGAWPGHAACDSKFSGFMESPSEGMGSLKDWIGELTGLGCRGMEVNRAWYDVGGGL